MTKNVDISKGLSKLKQAARIKQEVMKPVFNFYRRITPKKLGYAQAHTYLDQKSNRIIADYSYAADLDAGKSKKAPQGMSRPAAIELKRLVREYIKRLKR